VSSGAAAAPDPKQAGWLPCTGSNTLGTGRRRGAGRVSWADAREACLELVAGAAPTRPSPRGSCLSDVLLFEGRPPAPHRPLRRRSRASVPLRWPPTRHAVTLPCLKARLSVGHLTHGHGRVQDPRYAHKEATAAAAGPESMSPKLLQVRKGPGAQHRVPQAP